MRDMGPLKFIVQFTTFYNGVVVEQYDQGIDYELSCYTELTLKVYEGYICVDVK